jgi:hypothetical protein
MHGPISRSALALPFILCAASAQGADPRFVQDAGALPVPHVYSGGWAHFVGGGVAVLDCDSDGRPDLFAAGGEAPAALFRNVSTPFGPLAFQPLDLTELTGVTGAYPLDLDGDALLDLFVLRVGPNVALRGRGECRFEDATAALGIDPGDGWSTAFSATWEGDGRPTLAVGDYVDRDDPDGPFGTCDGAWLHRPAAEGWAPPRALSPAFCPLSMLFSDWRRDGRPMLRVSNDRHYYVREGREQMWALDPLRELGPEDGWAPLQLWGMGIASRDVTGDGLPEVMLTSMGDQLLMTNDGSAFAPAPYETGATAHRPHVGDDGRPSTGWHAEFADVDNDTRPDLFIAKGNVDQMPGMAMEDPNSLLMALPDGTFAENGASAGIATTERSRGAALVDLNADGLLDLAVMNRRAPMELHRNVTEGAGNWLSVALQQEGGNRQAVGAFIELRTTQGLQVREHTVGGGHVSGAAVPMHFGLGSAEEAEIRVIWPDGEAGPWRRLDAGTTHRIERD